MSLAACGAKAEEPAVKTDEEETAAETALNSPEHDDVAQPEQSKEPNAEFELPEGTISLYIPEEGWSASLTDDKVVITSQDYEETWMYVYFDDFFGVCGTGLEQRKEIISGRPAISGYYDGKPWWDYTTVGEFETTQLIITKAGMHWDEKEPNETADIILHSIVIH
jgi:hypothetical protein